MSLHSDKIGSNSHSSAIFCPFTKDLTNFTFLCTNLLRCSLFFLPAQSSVVFDVFMETIKGFRTHNHEFRIIEIGKLRNQAATWCQGNLKASLPYPGVQPDVSSICTATMHTLADLHTKFSGARPPTAPNSFIFTYIFTEKCPRRRSTPPYGKSWIRPWHALGLKGFK